MTPGGGSAGDPYVYPGTEVLRNTYGVRDATLLEKLERALVRRREATAPEFPLTAHGFQAAHRHLFGQLYPWAGELRTVDISKGSSRVAHAAYLRTSLEGRFRDLERQSALTRLDPDTFSARAAHHVSELNAIHPFREGNGRTTRLHLQQLAAQAEHRLDGERIPAAAWLDASKASFAGNETPLTALIRGALAPERRISLAEARLEASAAASSLGTPHRAVAEATKHLDAAARARAPALTLFTTPEAPAVARLLDLGRAARAASLVAQRALDRGR